MFPTRLWNRNLCDYIYKVFTNKSCNCMKCCSLWRTPEVSPPWRTESLWVHVAPPLCRNPFREGGQYFWRMYISSCVELGGIRTDCLVSLLLLYFRLTSFHLESVSVALLFRRATPPPTLQHGDFGSVEGEEESPHHYFYQQTKHILDVGPSRPSIHAAAAAAGAAASTDII